MASPNVTREMTDEEFDSHALDILARELGPGGYARFIRMHRSGPGDYTRDRHHWLAAATLDDLKRDLLP